MASKIAIAIAEEQAKAEEAAWKQAALDRLANLEKRLAELEKLVQPPVTAPSTRGRKKATD